MTIRFDLRGLLLVIAVAGWITGCTTRKEPSRVVQVCLMDQVGVGEFQASMRRLAGRNGMRLSDQSERVESELELISKETNSAMPVKKVIHIAVDQGNTLQISTGNVGLTDYQVLVSFFEKRGSGDAKRISDEFLKELRAKWRTVNVPPGVGAKAIPSCP
jgi:hypothetical protein